MNTSDNALIKHLLIQASDTLKSELEDVLTNKPIVKKIEEGITFSGIEKNNNTIWNLLLFSGYLTYSHLEWIESKALCTLKIPNKEVKVLYDDLIQDIFTASFR